MANQITVTGYAEGLLDDIDAPTARGTLGVISESEVLALAKSHMPGLMLSNNATDADHDIDIATGEAVDSTASYLLKLTTGLTKQIDAVWAAGTNVGGLFSGAVAADTWYYVFLIRKDSDGSLDAGFDTDISAANIPAGYTAYRRIGAVLTDSAANIWPFGQREDRFYFTNAGNHLEALQARAPTLTFTLDAPPNMVALARCWMYSITENNAFGPFDTYGGWIDGVWREVGQQELGLAAVTSRSGKIELEIPIDASSQMRVWCSSTNGNARIACGGWIDRRGRDAA